MKSFDILLSALFVLIALAGTAVALIREPKRQVFMLSFFGMLQAILFFALHSPDVALSELAVGTVVLPAFILLTLARLEGRQK